MKGSSGNFTVYACFTHSKRKEPEFVIIQETQTLL